MNLADDDFIAQLEDYLETYEGVVPLPVSVRDAVHANLPSTRQVDVGGVTERARDVASRISRPAQFAVGVAAVVAVIVVSSAFLNLARPGPDVGGVLATPTPLTSPTAPPTPLPSPARLTDPAMAYCGDGTTYDCLLPGRYMLSPSVMWPGMVTFDVPAGWFLFGSGAGYEGVLANTGPEAPDGSGWGVVFLRVNEVRADPCESSAGKIDPAETASVDGLIAAMQEWPGFEVSTPQPIEIDGYQGKLVELTSTRTTADCPENTIWTIPNGALVDAYPMVTAAGDPARPGQFRILDVEGSLLIIRTTDFGGPSPFELFQGVADDPERHVPDQAELHAMLDSIQIDP